MKQETQKERTTVYLSKEDKAFAKKYGIYHPTLRKFKAFYKEEDSKEWINIMQQNPYLIMEEGVKFSVCDNMAKKIRFDLQSPIRIKSYIPVSMNVVSQGSSIIPMETVIKDVVRKLKITEEDNVLKTLYMNNGEKYLLLGKDFKRVKENNGAMFMTKTSWYKSERFLFEWMKKLQNKFSRVGLDNGGYLINEDIVPKTLTDEQRNVVNNILNYPCSVLIGKGGTGKSFTMKSVLDVMDDIGFTYTLLTPTGIASVNLTEQTGRPSSTIHKMYYDSGMIKTDYVIIDEFGMCGVDHLSLLREMIPYKDVKVIFVGDTGQLPSISVGDFLGDVIQLLKNKKVEGEIFELTKIMRASDETFIPYIGNMFYGANTIDPESLKGAMKCVELVGQEQDICKQLDSILEDKQWEEDDTVILIPQHVGDRGCTVVNEYFQKKNDNMKVYESRFKTFKIGDKLVQTKNDSKKGVFNGEIMRVLGKDKGTDGEDEFFIKRVRDNQTFVYSKDELDSLQLAYAMTVHKCQGSTIPNVIFVAIPEHSFMLTRELVYTGLSRSAKNLMVIGDVKTLETASKRNNINKRLTFLKAIAYGSTK